MAGFLDYFDDILGSFGLDDDTSQVLRNYLLGYAAQKSGIGDFLGITGSGDQGPQGYTKPIPKYTAIREPVQYDEIKEDLRRPGSGGRRYFSDVVYAERPDTTIPTVEEARQKARTQAEGLASLAPNPVLTVESKIMDTEEAKPDPTRPSDVSSILKPEDRLPPMSKSDPIDPDVLDDIVIRDDFPYYIPEEKLTEEVTPDPTEPFINSNDLQKKLDQIKEQDAGLNMNQGGIASINNGYYLGGMSDGMADKVPARLDDGGEARLSDGEFVIPADVVSHLGNGNSNAGAKKLHNMMDNVRKARTGREEQGIEINANKFMPMMNQGGLSSLNYYSGQQLQEGTPPSGSPEDTGTDTYNPTLLGTSESLSPRYGEYVDEFLAEGSALADMPYEAYTGPLTAGESELQAQAFKGIGDLKTPDNMGAYVPETLDATQIANYMNPYLQSALDPQLAEARRQAEIDRVNTAGRLTRAGGFGGSRQAVMESEGLRNLADLQSKITGEGYKAAYDKALDAFYKQQDLGRRASQDASQYGFDVLDTQSRAGETQRGITSEGIEADRQQFEEEKLYPFKMQQFQKSLLSGLPISVQERTYSQPTEGQELAGIISDLARLFPNIFKGSDSSSESTIPEEILDAVLPADPTSQMA
jgi:hypothetical protein